MAGIARVLVSVWVVICLKEGMVWAGAKPDSGAAKECISFVNMLESEKMMLFDKVNKNKLIRQFMKTKNLVDRFDKNYYMDLAGVTRIPVLETESMLKSSTSREDFILKSEKRLNRKLKPDQIQKMEALRSKRKDMILPYWKSFSVKASKAYNIDYQDIMKVVEKLEF